MYHWENLVGPFLVHYLLGPGPSPPPPLSPLQIFPCQGLDTEVPSKSSSWMRPALCEEVPRGASLRGAAASERREQGVGGIGPGNDSVPSTGPHAHPRQHLAMGCCRGLPMCTHFRVSPDCNGAGTKSKAHRMAMRRCGRVMWCHCDPGVVAPGGA